MYDYSKFSPEMRAKLSIRATLGDITPFNLTSGSAMASRVHQVTSGGTPPAINAGEPVTKTVGASQYVIIAANAAYDASSSTAKCAGIATTTSTETATAAGTVSVTPIDAANQIWLISPNVAATYGQTSGAQNQTTYNALVGARVLLQSTSGAWTLTASDSVNNGCVVENLDITKYPGKVAFSIRAGTSYLA